MRRAVKRQRTVVAPLSGAFAIETSMYSAVAPLLPYYAARLDLDKTDVGILAALYAVGVVIGSVLGVRLVHRIGIKQTTAASLLMLAISTVAFGFSETIVPLDISRLVQGTSAGCMWAGALTWILVSVGGRRGGAIGTAMGAAVVGTIAGPLIGMTAVQLGPRPGFAACAAIMLCFAVVVARLQPPAAERTDPTSGLHALRRPTVLASVWLVVLPGILVGGVNALVPLRLADLGASDFVIGAVFVTGAIIGAAASPAVGKLTDRRGPIELVVAGLCAATACCLAMGMAGSAQLLAFATVIFIGVALIGAWVPAMTLLADQAQLAGATPVLAAAAVNVSLSLGEAVGSPSSAWLADAAGTDAIVFAAFAAAAVATAAAAGRTAQPTVS